MDRRTFLQSLAAAAAAPGLGACSRATAEKRKLQEDPAEIIQLPPGFDYRIVSRMGTRMSDGFRVPGRHAGMAAFDDQDGRVRLVCNHECGPWHGDMSAFRDGLGEIADDVMARFYDRGQGKTPGVGGTTAGTQVWCGSGSGEAAQECSPVH